MNYATIDIGSNTVLLLIASFGPSGKIKPLLEKATITRLGENLDQNNQLAPEAIERTLKALRQYTDLCHRNQVAQIACVGTEALRRAENAVQFIHKVQELCGFKVEIIPGKKEAELAYLSALLDFKEIYPNLVAIDLGGGSTEIIWQTEKIGDTTKLQMVSLKIGSVRLTEKFVKCDPISKEELEQLVRAIEERFEQDLSSLALPKHPLTLIGLAGTVTTLASIDQKLARYNSLKVQGATLTDASLQKIIKELKMKNLRERQKIIGMEPKRADVLLAGALILERVMKKLKINQLIVSDHGIRYGLFYQKFVMNG